MSLYNVSFSFAVFILISFSSLRPGGIEGSITAAFLCLPYIIATNTLKRGKSGKGTWRPSKLECLQGFIHHIRSDTDIEATIATKREKLRALGLTVQPFIIIVGPSLSEISGHFIVVNDTFYKVKSIMEAVDYCFKIFLVLSAEYPLEAAPVWFFIQKAFYEISTVWDKQYTVVNSLLADIGVPHSNEQSTA